MSISVYERVEESTVEAPELYPTSPPELPKRLYLGKDLQDPVVAGPQAVLDLAVVRRNCQVMLQTVDHLGVSFRAHVKTHKTTEVARLQVGEAPRPVRLIVSTVAEAEHLLPFLDICKEKQSRSVSILYGVPPSAASVRRLKPLQKSLGTESVSFLVDHPAQLRAISESAKALASKEQIPVFIKVDTGYSRAGVTPRTKSFETLVTAVSTADGVRLQGFYCHHGSSYGVSNSDAALNDLTHEINTVMAAASTAEALGVEEDKFVLSVGATPTTTSTQNLLNQEDNTPLMHLIKKAHTRYDLELHAGVYPFLDLQQLATHARPSISDGSPTMNTSDIGMRILVEVLSVYSERDKPEALISAGSLALGREPCKSYPGWGVVAPSPWQEDSEPRIYTEETRTGWIVGRISQEHGILTWEGNEKDARRLEVGDKLLLWPNHACIAAAGFGWYLVVDSDPTDVKGTQIVDVWTRWRGW